jgi:hypothetical protein
MSTEGGFAPLWARSGREVFFRAGDLGTKTMVVDIETKSELRVGKPRVLFETRREYGLGGGDYDVAPDGRFLVIRAGPRESEHAHLDLVLNWFDDLRRRASASGAKP